MPPNQYSEAHVDPEQPFDDDETVPEDALAAARKAFNQRSSEKVVPLVYDSLVDDGEPPEDHLLSFENDDLRVTVRVSVNPTAVGLSGSASPAAQGRYELVLEQGELSFACDSPDGSFDFGPVGHGVVRLAYDPVGGEKVHTDWFRI